MGTSLPRYLSLKAHQLLTERAYEGITVIGKYRRSAPSIIFQSEKQDKAFNWQRPTARIENSNLYIECFPGYDHVEHYAEIIAAYLRIRRQDGDTITCPSKVSFIPPSCSETLNCLDTTNLWDFPEGVDTVVLGLVHHLEQLTGVINWPGDECFAWKIPYVNGSKIAFLGFRPSFWGDIAGEVVNYLASRCGVCEVIYFGKLGSVRTGVRPNTWLATGGTSFVRGKLVEWENVLEKSVATLAKDYTIIGSHLTVGSVLHETKDWLANLPGAIDFVDPEVGMMARAAVKSRIRFGYLHIISDNVAEKYDEDLSNERMQNVLTRRSKLYELVQNILGHHLSSAPISLSYAL